MVGLEMGEPEDEGFDVNGTTLTGSVRIHRDCVDCGDEMKEATFDFEEELTHPDGTDCKSTLDEDDEDYVEPSFMLDSTDLQPLEEGGGRYAKSYFGVDVTAYVSCEECGVSWDVTMSDKTAASYMDELY
jgi:hypothetical protein